MNRSLSRSQRCSALIFVTLLAPLGCSQTAPPCEARYATPLSSDRTTLYVAATCEGAELGTAEAPYHSISAALAVAGADTDIVVADGTYKESLSIAKAGLRLIGRLSTDQASAGIILQEQSPEDSGIILQAQSPEDSGIILQAPSPEEAGIILQVPAPDVVGIILQSPSPTGAVVVDGVSGVVLRGVRITAAVGIGVSARNGAQVLLSQCRVENTAATSDGQFGYGVAGAEGSSIILQHTAVVGSAGPGVLLSGAAGQVFASVLAQNGGGGLRIDGSSGPAVVDLSLISKNQVAGIAAMSAQLRVVRSTIIGTRPSAAGAYGDGVLAGILPGGVPSDIQVGGETAALGNRLEGNARTGVLLAGARGIILQNTGADNEGPGVWIQDATGGVTVGSNRLRSNRLFGVGLYASVGVDVRDNEVSATRSGAVIGGTENVTIGDGLALLGGSAAVVRGNSIHDNARVGVLVEGGLAETSITQNEIRDNGQGVEPPPGGALGIILQRPKPEAGLDVVASDTCALGTGDCNLLSGNAGGDQVYRPSSAEGEVGLAGAARAGYGIPE